MNKEYPLYPTLSEEAKIEAQLLMDEFKDRMGDLCKEVLDRLYCDVSAYIESDHWNNYRNDLLSGLQNYGNRKIQASYDFGKIRRAIFDEFKDEIIDDLNQDLVKENENLKDLLERERELRYL
jgi:CO dehydrogenase/acetyl-CoA synthase beta subunit